MNRKRLALALLLGLAPLGVGALVLQGQSGVEGPRLFAQVLRMVEQYAVDSLTTSQIYEKAARGLVKNLEDPYAELYSPEQLASFQRNTLGNNYGGIGMQIESQDGLITVTRVFPGTPGEQGGVQAGDRIMMVDTVAVTGFRLEEVSGRLTGPAGTRVHVTFARAGFPEPIRTTFTRAIIKVPAVPYTLMLEDGVGYLPLQRFNESAGDQMEQAVRDLKRRGARSFVFDLRRNPGGSLEESLRIGNLFLEPGVEIASVRHRGKAPEIFRANQRSIIDSMSIVVLVDQYSASASEIVAGTLQDHDRALVVGTSSFGKGLVQTLYPLDGGWAIKLTTGKWYTPSGRSIQGEHKQLADGRFVEYAPDSAESDASKRTRPVFRSTGGRVVYGGGGVTPDVIVRPDTISSPEQEFLRVLGAKWSVLYNAVYSFARELKGTVPADFRVTPAWHDAIYQRLTQADVQIDRALYDGAAPYVTRMLEERVASLSFGDSAAFRRTIPEDLQLVTALDYLKRGKSQRDLLALAAASTASKN
jgi:carboxyl-terminal processing protease